MNAAEPTMFATPKRPVLSGIPKTPALAHPRTVPPRSRERCSVSVQK
jgi:hypothetical protein